MKKTEKYILLLSDCGSASLDDWCPTFRDDMVVSSWSVGVHEMTYRRFSVAEMDVIVRLPRELNPQSREDGTNMFNECSDRRNKNVLRIMYKMTKPAFLYQKF